MIYKRGFWSFRHAEQKNYDNWVTVGSNDNVGRGCVCVYVCEERGRKAWNECIADGIRKMKLEKNELGCGVRRSGICELVNTVQAQIIWHETIVTIHC